MHTTRDLANLLQLMQTSRQSGDLIIEAPADGETSWQGRLRLVDGQITLCQVRAKTDGRFLLRDSEAVRWLISSERGKLQWSLEESSPLPETFLPILPTTADAGRDEHNNINKSDPYPIVPNNSNARNTYLPLRNNADASRSYSNANEQNIQPGVILKRTELGNKAPGLVLSSRDLRQVFALVDGRRTVEEIVRLLHKSPDSVVRLLNELKAAKLLE